MLFKDPSAMTDQELGRTLLGFKSWDTGDRGAGISCRELRYAVEKHLNELDEEDLRLTISDIVRDLFLSEDALKNGYGWEDALAFLQWFSDGDYRS